jgi:hypothetical protein
MGAPTPYVQAKKVMIFLIFLVIALEIVDLCNAEWVFLPDNC